MPIKAETDAQERARQNRQIVAAGIGNKFYEEQESIAEGWPVGEKKPKRLVVAEDGGSKGKHRGPKPARGDKQDGEE